MSSLFANDEDSDVERAEKQRRTLESIQADALEEPRKDFQNRDEDVRDQPSEEQELKQLRENVRYQKYAAERKRNRTPSPQSSKRPRSHPNGIEYEQHGEIDNGPGISPDSPISRRPSKVYKNNNVQSDVTERQPDALQEANASSTRTALNTKDEPRCGLKVDPKIIDDSSDDDSSSGGKSSDESSDEAPIGPALPEEAAREQLRPLLDALPIHNEAVLGDKHGSYVSTVSIDKAGNRIASGSIDSKVMLFDFNSMTRSLMSFRSVTPLGSAPVRNLQYVATGGLLLCSGGTNSAMILDRDGNTLSQTAKGDMYIVDMDRTKGHIGAILSAKWRPNTKDIVTTSADATIRLWDVTRTTRSPMVDNPVVSQLRVTKLRNSKGGKALATAMDWDVDGKSCIFGCSDGRIKVISPDTYSLRPQDETLDVLQPGTEVTSVTVAPDSCASPLLLVRSSDDSLRVFDRRKLRSPLKLFQNLPNSVSETNTCFLGEMAQYFLTGTSAKRKGGSVRGGLRLFDTRTLEEMWESEAEEDTGSVVFTSWHKSINQIVYGSADGKIRVLYHPIESRKGVLRCLTKSDYRKKHGIANVGVGEIFLPSELHGHRSGRTKEGTTTGGKERSSAISKRGRLEASEALKPKPYSGPRTTSAEKTKSLAKHLAAGRVTQDWTLDPREAILQYADVAKNDPKFTVAYRETQPETILAEKTAEQEEEETRQAIYERDLLRRARAQRDEQRK